MNTAIQELIHFIENDRMQSSYTKEQVIELLTFKLNQNKMKQTAVDWLVDKFSTQGTLHSSDISQAKAMEKEQIKDAWFDGVTNWDSEKEVEDYINETFKSE